MSPVSPWDPVLRFSSTISFRHREVDFQPQVRFRPRYCLEVVPATYVRNLEKNLYREACGWLHETYGPEGEQWKALPGQNQFYFKDMKYLIAFKIAFGGFDKA